MSTDDEVTWNSYGTSHDVRANIYAANTTTNDPPNMTSVRITSLSNTTFHKLQGYATATDNNSDNVSYEWKWYKDGGLWDGLRKTTYNFTRDQANATSYIGSLNDASKAFDANFSSFGFCTVPGVNLYENYTTVNWTARTFINAQMGQTGGGGPDTINAYLPDGSTVGVINFTTIENKTGEVIRNAFTGGILQLRTDCASNHRYYELRTIYEVYNHTTQNQEQNLENVSPTNISIAESWTLSARVFDGLNYSTWLNSSTVTITAPNISLCDATYTYPVLNFTVKDEYNFTLLPSEHTGVFTYWDAYTPSTSWSTSNYLSNSSNFAYCILQPNMSIQSDYQIYYEDTNYPQRRYDGVNTTLNVTAGATNTDLYLMHEYEGIYARFKTEDSYNLILSGVSVVMEKYINGTLQVAETHVTDSSGFATFWVDPNQYYYFTFSKSGYVTQELTIRPTTTDDYTITMTSSIDNTPRSNMLGISYDFEPTTTPLINNTLYSFNFTLNSTYWTISYCGLFLYNQSGNLLQSSTDSTPQSCFISISQDTLNYTKIQVKAVFTENGTNVTLYRYYDVLDTSTGALSIKTFLDDLTAFGRSGFNTFTRMLIALIITMGIIYGISSAFSFSIAREGDVEAILLLIVAITFLFSWLGWYTITNIPFPEGPGLANVGKYMIFYVTFLGTLGWILGRSR